MVFMNWKEVQTTISPKIATLFCVQIYYLKKNMMRDVYVVYCFALLLDKFAENGAMKIIFRKQPK